MSTLVNPFDAFKTFEPALKRGDLEVERGRVDPDLIVHMDRPNGQVRVTYAKMRGASIGAIAIIIPAENLEGKPVFQIGYAVPQHLRRRGLGKAIIEAAMAEFTAGMAKNGITNFHFEAIVGVKNIASKRSPRT